MGLAVGVLKETAPGERRVALVPRALEALASLGLQIWIERGAGIEAGFPDSEYETRGALLAGSADEVREHAQVLLAVQVADSPGLGAQHTVIGLCDALDNPRLAAAIAARGASLFSLDLIPRITRAQSMDVLSSMATVAGYKAVILAAESLPRMFPLLMTAAGTVPPAKVLVLGAGVAGLQAIATARRLGALVSGYDVRAAVKEQVESLGARFVSITLDGAGAEGEGGYAKTLDEEVQRRQRDQLAEVMREQDVIITTAAVPGKRAPLLLTSDMVRVMSPGSVIVDLAAERGGNCELTRPGERAVEFGVIILGPVNLPSSVPYHASQMYARNLVAFLRNLIRDGELRLNLEDEIVRDTLIARNGEVVHTKVQALLETVVHA
ncbi:MAG: Re/Si-specific NAD(P)(+) transhydrogenase subunit alpha [Acidobacteria bacterium]|nr:Re/Si-specific NAD(P)(+) transhydrogenase subunit alpha [Acidobacteriota bacterium]MBI3278669.1 Re/Si-specific NAD(P)(+) transhydrogenase subunit alpha [Acidobacteriota bacterium]